ncbi:MAG TPA: porphobilinogen synthase [Phycisphaerae bacterium]|nr:porphobilinogen synthase [Phycisphaerae bacterium]
MSFPDIRMRRLRRTPTLRRMVRQTQLSVDDLIAPLFVRPGSGIEQPVDSMPGVAQMSVDRVVEECRRIESLGIPAVILFGIPEHKDAVGSDTWSDDGIIQKALGAIREACRDLVLITDVCFCEYTDHGHCGVIATRRDGTKELDNDASLENLARQVISHVKHGADIVAPSCMLDGMVVTIRDALDGAGYEDVPILAYAAKFASGFYGPFRDVAESAPEFGDRAGYQMDPANADEALREVALDVDEGADIVMVKPAINYLDIIWRVKEQFGLPTAAYHVSGEFSMLKAAAANGWLDEKRCALEATAAIKRAGADLILTYYAKDLAGWLG